MRLCHRKNKYTLPCNRAGVLCLAIEQVYFALPLNRCTLPCHWAGVLCLAIEQVNFLLNCFLHGAAHRSKHTKGEAVWEQWTNIICVHCNYFIDLCAQFHHFLWCFNVCLLCLVAVMYVIALPGQPGKLPQLLHCFELPWDLLHALSKMHMGLTCLLSAFIQPGGRTRDLGLGTRMKPWPLATSPLKVPDL